MARPLTVDIHTHIIPADIPRFSKLFGYSGFVHLEHHKDCCARMIIDDKFFREIQHNCWDPKVRLHECDFHQVDVQVLSTIPVLFSYWAKDSDCLEVSKFLNNHIASVVNDFPDRFVGLGTIPMQNTAMAIKELEHCVKDLGLAGVQIGSHVNGYNLDDPRFFEIFEAAQELDAAVFIHPWDMLGKERMAKYWMPWLVGMPAETTLAICSMIFGGVFERLPKLRVAFAHGGGAFPASIGRIEHGFNVRPDLVAVDNQVNPREYLGKFWIDSLVHDPKVLDLVLDMFGPDKVALGTDYPFPLGELEPGKLIRSMPYDEETKAKLLGGAALQWLGMREERFRPERKEELESGAEI